MLRWLLPVALLPLMFVAPGADAASPRVVALRLHGVVGPFVASYIEKGIAAANRDRDDAVLLTIDTPGGLDSSM